MQLVPINWFYGPIVCEREATVIRGATVRGGRGFVGRENLGGLGFGIDLQLCYDILHSMSLQSCTSS